MNIPLTPDEWRRVAALAGKSGSVKAAIARVLREREESAGKPTRPA